eukprot:GHVP01060952.1.p1 GENE.GHVP01060952.1~~GHVP01060952.1.p1  ORF type:complete len:125 (+),score=28.02 GHVP01060952.1:761-1135(+)
MLSADRSLKISSKKTSKYNTEFFSFNTRNLEEDKAMRLMELEDMKKEAVSDWISEMDDLEKKRTTIREKLLCLREDYKKYSEQQQIVTPFYQHPNSQGVKAKETSSIDYLLQVSSLKRMLSDTG